MYNKILDRNTNYVERFLSKQSKTLEIPDFKYLDARFHPQHTDHIIVLSKNEFPDEVVMTNCWDNYIYGISDLDTKYPEIFKEELEKVEKAKKKSKDKKPDSNTNEKKGSSGNKSPALNKTNEILEETKNMGIVDSDDDSYDYDGGEGEEDDEVKKEEDDKDDKEEEKGDDKKSQVSGEKLIEDDLKETAIPKKDDAKVSEDKDSTGDDKKQSDEEDKSSNDKKKDGTDDQTEDENSATDLKETATKAPGEEDESKQNSEDDKEEDISNKTPGERFELLTKEEKQKVVDNTMDRVIPEQQNNFKFNYHNHEESFKPKDYVIPESEKLSTENTTYAMSDYVSWYPKQPYKTIEYNPPILREKFQLSIWKSDAYGVYKIKDRYFTPKNERANSEDFRGFTLKVSLDSKSIYLVEETSSSTKEDLLVLIIDNATLEITKELIVKIRDPEFNSEGYDDYYDSYYDDSYSKFGTSSSIGRINVTNNGKKVIVGVTKEYKKVHYYYAIYNTETGEIENKIQRTQDNKLENKMISCMKQNPDKPDEIIIGTYKGETIEFQSFNMTNGNCTLINSNDK